MKASKPTAKKATKKIAKKGGNISAREITPLIMAATKAFKIQEEYGNVDTGETFDSWRHKQCVNAVGKPGITACNHGDFRPLLAHFQTLAGDDSSAFKNLMKSGPARDNAAPGDTHEERRQTAHTIADILSTHQHLATSTPAALAAEIVEFYQASGNPRSQEEVEQSAVFKGILERKSSIEQKGSITVGYIVYLTRAKTRRPDLKLGSDWIAGLAERCTVKQLTQIRATLVNRIAAVEGTGTTQGRNKSQRDPRRKAAAERKQQTPRW